MAVPPDAHRTARCQQGWTAPDRPNGKLCPCGDETSQKEAAALDSGLIVLIHLVDDTLDTQMIPFRAIALLASALGLLGLALASIGLYGVMAFIISQRTREIGIRIALGAQRRNLITLFLRQGGKLMADGRGIIAGTNGGGRPTFS